MFDLHLKKEYVWPSHCTPSFYPRYVHLWYNAVEQHCIIEIRSQDCYGSTPKIISNIDEVEVIYLFLGW